MADVYGTDVDILVWGRKNATEVHSSNCFVR